MIQPSSWAIRGDLANVQLPPYMPHTGVAVSDQVTARQKEYDLAASSLRAELRRAEDAMMAALDEQDRREDARNRNRVRIAKMAREQR